MSNHLSFSVQMVSNVGERLCYNRSSSLRLPSCLPYMPVFFFYDVMNLLWPSLINTCLRLSHVNRIHMLSTYLFCMTTLYYKTPSVLQSQYGLLHYAYLTRWTSHFLYAYHIRRSPYARFVRTTSLPYQYHPLSVIFVLHMIPSLLRIQ